MSGNFGVCKTQTRLCCIAFLLQKLRYLQVEKLSEGYEVFKWKAATREISLELEIASRALGSGLGLMQTKDWTPKKQEFGWNTWIACLM